MANGRGGGVGYKRVIILAAVSTAFAILMDNLGVIDRISRMLP